MSNSKTSCVGVEEHHAVDIDLYHCPNCAILHGPSQMKKRRNWHRHDYTEPDDGSRPVQAGTRTFVKQLRARSFPSADEVILKMHGSQLTQRYLEKHGFDVPIMVPKLDGLGLRLPPPTFSVLDVERYVGGDKVIDVIDVARQADSKMKLHNYIKYFTNPDRPKVLNVISLEFSDTKMSELVEVPDIARKLSWVENYWPDDSVFPKPFVQKYCLMGVQDSYTDFHIDFGGTSVWYHVLWGEKIFYLIKPTDENLALYESWSSSVTQSEVYFGDKVDKCYKCVVKQGHTLFVPTGWIHAVLTSQDCMAFGGNFLHNLNIGMQLRCYEMEKRLKTPDLFKFPFFEAICWFVAKNLLETLKELREDGFQPPSYLVQGVKALLTALKLWMKKEIVNKLRRLKFCHSEIPSVFSFEVFSFEGHDSNECLKYVSVDHAEKLLTVLRLVTEHAFEIPDNIRPGHLIKELSKVIRSVEEENSKLVKTQGILGVSPTSRSSHETASPHHSRRRVRKLRDHATKTPSNLDILELHTREDTASSKLNGRFNKPFQPSSTVPEWRTKDNDLRLLLSNGRIIRDERRPFTDRSLYTADSEDEDDRTRSKKTTVKVEDQPSGCEGEGNADAQKPLNMFFESVKSELRNGSSEYSDISDSEESEPDCTTQQKDSSTEESESSGDEEKQEVTSNFKEESKVMRDLCQNTQKPSRNETPSKKECPTSTSTEEEAIQGMLSMAGLHYTTCLPGHTQSTDCTNKRTSLQEHRSYARSRHKDRQPSQSHRTVECGRSVKEEERDLGTSAWTRHLNEASRITPQDANKTQKYIKKEGTSEANYKVQENRSIVHNNSLSFQHGKYTRDSSLIQGECQLSDGSLSPDRPYGETSFSVPLHPTKRPASNPPPISNQATKGSKPVSTILFLNGEASKYNAVAKVIVLGTLEITLLVLERKPVDPLCLFIPQLFCQGFNEETNMVGSGIFISPKGVLKNSGTVGFSLVVWFACGLLSMFGALCYAELGTRITKSGGHYIYILETLGPLPSFLFLWAEFFAIRPANSAVVSLAFGRYMLEPFFAPCAAPVPAVKLVSLLGYYMVLTLNSWSVTWSARLQTALSIVKLLALTLIIVPGMMLLAQGHTENFQDAFDRESLVLDKLPLAFYAGMFAYSGWFQASFVREELVRPERNIPLAVIISVITVIVGYMLTNVSYYAVLGTQDVLASPAVAVFPLVTAMVCIGDIYHLMNFFSFSRWLFIGLATLGLIVHRHRHPELHSPFKGVAEAHIFDAGTIDRGSLAYPVLVTVPLFVPVSFTIICLFTVAMSFYSDPVSISIGCTTVLSGFPVYYVIIHRQMSDRCRNLFCKYEFEYCGPKHTQDAGLFPGLIPNANCSTTHRLRET
ncbi:Lysine-specific demethylase 7A [Pitangus sulphuratus]|nr:Lysine-specific demethylase 7A [Pitangus sulphuratus]